jgi:digeranylgeranylglycerophospholipid reductase
MKFNKEYDVIVVGAGPAGTTFARYASAHGLNVLVVDKRKEIGVPVRCGEGLGADIIVEQGLHMPKRAFSTEIDGAKIVGPSGKAVIWKNEQTKGWVLDRRVFDKWLAELAVKEGAHVVAHTEAEELIREGGEIRGVVLKHNGHQHDVFAPLIVSAEGMEAHLAFQAGFNTVHRLYDVDTCYQYEVKGYEHERLIELYFGSKIAPRGYVWIFPKEDDKANVGIGIGAHLQNAEKSPGIRGADPKQYLDAFIEKHPVLKDSSVLNEFGGIICVGASLDRFVKDHFMVIGTAAKQVDPIHGGGIALAMRAGELAARVAVKAVEHKDFSERTLSEYERLWEEKEGKTLKQRLALRKVMEQLDDEEWDAIFHTITDKDIKDVMDGNFAHVVAKVVANKPTLLLKLKALIE